MNVFNYQTNGLQIIDSLLPEFIRPSLAARCARSLITAVTVFPARDAPQL